MFCLQKHLQPDGHPFLKGNVSIGWWTKYLQMENDCFEKLCAIHLKLDDSDIQQTRYKDLIVSNRDILPYPTA